MNRKNFYEELSNELLGAFYYNILEKIENNFNVERMYQELKLIKEVAKDRGISLIELRIMGNWFIQKEKVLTEDVD